MRPVRLPFPHSPPSPHPSAGAPLSTARRTHGFRESVIRGMSRLAREHRAINLAQGFPNFPAPDLLKEAAARAIHEDINQYAITWTVRKQTEVLGGYDPARYRSERLFATAADGTQ